MMQVVLTILLVFLIIKFLTNNNSNINFNSLTIIGNKNITRRSHITRRLFSKFVVNGPFYCYVTWTNHTQAFDIYTDDNIHPYIIVNINGDTLTIMIQSDGNFKFTRMDIHLNLNPTIKNIRLAGISTLQSANVLSMNVPFRLQTEDTSNVILQLNVPHFDALFLSAGVTELIGLVQDTTNIRYYGIGDVDISQLFCKSINITANGLGTIWMTGIDECVIKAEGINIVRYNCSNRNSIQAMDLAKVIPI